MFENITEKATAVINNKNVKETIEKAKTFVESEKGKEVVETVKEKATGFFKDHFGKK